MTTATIASPSAERRPASLGPAETGNLARTRAGWRGFWSAVLTAVLASAALAIGITTPPRSGPNCTSGCITAPYTAAAAAFVPRDYLWMYPALLLAVAFVVLVACIHHFACDERTLYGQVGLAFAVMAATALSTDYFIQLAVLQPSLLKGETEGLSLFSQYNPHGVFIALEDVGYVLMGTAFLFVGAVFAGRNRLERSIRWLFIIGGLAEIAALIVLAAIYGQDLEYRFEVIGLAIDWTTLISTGVLLSVLFRRLAQGSLRQ